MGVSISGFPNGSFNASFNDPNVVITTWDDIRMLAFIVGIICLVAGYAIAEIKHRLKEEREEIPPR